MAKDKTIYVCSNCGQESPKWIGKCPQCGEWNSFKEFRVAAGPSSESSFKTNGLVSPQTLSALNIKDISSTDDPRIDMEDDELNRVLGGGLVKGSLTLLGGEPGIGKSTLSLQTVLGISKKVLYVSGEESAHQLKMRA